MKSPKGIVGLILAIVALAGVPTPTWAGETEFAPARLHGTRIHHRVEVFYWRDRRFDRQYYPALTFRGGWYALNYPYYWGYGPAVGYYDPYDANGNYFPHPLPRR